MHALSLLLIMLACLAMTAGAQPRKKNAPDAATPVTAEQAAGLEAVITTEAGVIRFEFLPEQAIPHVQHFVKLAREGFYDGSAFHRVIPRGIIQGGDPLLKDPKTPRSRWGTGALSQLSDEFSSVKHVRGTVSTVRLPDRANTDGAQFFICVTPQPALDGKFSAFGQVTEGMDIVEKISIAQADENQLALTPIKIVSIKIEPKKTQPYKDANVDEMRKEVILRTTVGDITVALEPEIAPEHVRNFLMLVESGWYDHTAFHRIVPHFVVQGGIGTTRSTGPQPEIAIECYLAEFIKQLLCAAASRFEP